MSAKLYGEYDLTRINEILANDLASNDRSSFLIEIWVKFFPIILSSLVAVYSIITTSFFYYISQVANLSLYILLVCIFLSIFSIYNMVTLNQSMPVELKISKKVELSKTSKEYSVQYLYKPIYDNSVVRSIKKTANELPSTAFVILFPGGISDIILGFASNDPQIGIYSTGQIITGIVFLAISVLLLLHSIMLERRNLRKSKAKETDTMRLIIEKVQAGPLKEEEIRVIFSENGTSFFYS